MVVRTTVSTVLKNSKGFEASPFRALRQLEQNVSNLTILNQFDDKNERQKSKFCAKKRSEFG